MWRVVTGMTINPTAQAGTALSPEWDRGFDEAFTELISSDPNWVRAEFDALVEATFNGPPTPPAPPAPPAAGPEGPQPEPTLGPVPPALGAGHQPDAAGPSPRPPP
jgi:hypothetical protein